jgi:NDP-sugar pyrophosphorylase family protein
MRALVMAAGLGTRLRPLTDTLPKPLVPVNGKPMVEYVLELLAAHGVEEALINVHYLPHLMVDFVNKWNGGGRKPRLSVQDESRAILGSGGAISLGAPWLFAGGEEIFVCNADVIGEPDLGALLARHRSLRGKGVECTLAVMPHPEAGRKYTGLRVEEGLVRGFERPGQPDPQLRHFPGYYVLAKSALPRLPAAGTEYSVVEALWKPLMAEGKLGAWDYHGRYFDLGTPADLQQAEAALKPAKD